jgi:hypothetical protein
MLPAYAAPVAIVAVLILSAGLVLWRFLRKRQTPEEMEKRRRLPIGRTGKPGSGEIQDVEGSVIRYSYVVAGVYYSNSQDVSSLEALLPADRMQLVGHVGIKFDPRIPANSIVICEEWSGVARARSSAGLDTGRIG